MTVTQAAKMLGCSPQTVRLVLQQGRVAWGFAVKNQKSSRWTYKIYPERFEKEVHGYGNQNRSDGADRHVGQ